MSEVWLSRVEFGAVLLLVFVLLGLRIRPGARSAAWQQRWKGLSAEGLVLLVVTVLVSGRYLWLLTESAGGASLPEMGTWWVLGYGLGCTLYLGAKAVRARQVVEEEGL